MHGFGDAEECWSFDHSSASSKDHLKRRLGHSRNRRRHFGLQSLGVIFQVEGLDVSAYQKKIDWKKVAGSKDFVFIKATEGSGLVDKAFASNWEGARAAGLLRGAYHFFHPGIDAIEQADLFLTKVVACELPPCSTLKPWTTSRAPNSFKASTSGSST